MAGGALGSTRSGCCASQARTAGGCEQVKVLVWTRPGLSERSRANFIHHDYLRREFKCLQLQEVATRWRCLEDLRRAMELVEETWGG